MFDPVEFLGRLAVLVPRPRINLLLYHGVLGARSAWRTEVVPHRRPGDMADTGVGEADAISARKAVQAEAPPRRALGATWVSMMARTFGFDVLACPRCGGRLRLIALIEGVAVIGRILRHLGLPTEIPSPHPARAPPVAARLHRDGWDESAFPIASF